MDRLLDFTVNLISNNRQLSDEEREIIQYGLEILFIKIIFTFFAMIIALLLHGVIESVLFLLSFSLIRTSAGGYHAKTRIQCFVFSMLMFALVIAVTKVNYICIWVTPVTILISVISVIIIWIAAPVETENRPVSDEEKVRFKRKTRGIIVLEIIVSVILFLLEKNQILLSVLLALIFTSILLLIGLLDNRKNCTE